MSSATTPTRAHHAGERPKKRMRRSLGSEHWNEFGARSTPSTPLRQHARKKSHSRVNSSQSKRKRDIPTPSSCRKRRRSSHHDDEHAPLFETKKFRVFRPDVEMQDAPAHVKETPSKRKRKKILKEVLRSEKISRSALRNLNANNLHTTRTQQAAAKPQNSAPVSHAEHSTQTRCSERVPTRHFSEESVVLTGEEQLEEVDISQCSEVEKQYIRENEHNKSHPLMTHLMDDGRCFVRIVRADGAVDYYTLYPHDLAQYQYYEHTY